MSESYRDIINLLHHVSETRPQMSLANRAAQFAPFAALTGYDTAIEETARHTDEPIELDEDTVTALNMKLRMLADMIADHPEISVTYFKADKKKEGGAYVVAAGKLKRIDAYEHSILLKNGEKIKMGDILDIQCELFGFHE